MTSEQEPAHATRGVIVAGGINLDTLAVSAAPTVAGTSNPGRTTRTHGGVGRNIAENLARLGTPTRLVGARGDDSAGVEILAALERLGVDVSGVWRREGSTGSYTAILEPTGDLVVSVADMVATESLSPEHVDGLDADWIVLDGNLMPDTVAHAIATATGPVLLDPVGVAKAERLATVGDLPVHTFTPNQQELVAFTGLDNEEAAVKACRARGMQHVWVRDGARGSRLHTPDGVIEIAVVPGPVADVTGAGDSMLAGYAHRLHQGASVADAARFSAAVAALTIASPHSVRPDLSDDLATRTFRQQEVR